MITSRRRCTKKMKEIFNRCTFWAPQTIMIPMQWTKQPKLVRLAFYQVQKMSKKTLMDKFKSVGLEKNDLHFKKQKPFFFLFRKFKFIYLSMKNILSDRSEKKYFRTSNVEDIFSRAKHVFDCRLTLTSLLLSTTIIEVPEWFSNSNRLFKIFSTDKWCTRHEYQWNSLFQC